MSAEDAAAATLLAALQRDCTAAAPGLRLRPEQAADRAAMEQLYASTRAAEMARVDWPEPTKQAFVRQQFDAQHGQYRLHYAGALFLVVELEHAVIGRIYIKPGSTELRLMEITLEPPSRGLGLGRVLLQALLVQADDCGLPLTLHVEPYNPAHAWYLRLGFAVVEERGAYHFMRRLPQPTAAVKPG